MSVGSNPSAAVSSLTCWQLWGSINMSKGGGSESTIIIGPSKSVLVYALQSVEYVVGLARFRVFVPKKIYWFWLRTWQKLVSALLSHSFSLCWTDAHWINTLFPHDKYIVYIHIFYSFWSKMVGCFLGKKTVFLLFMIFQMFHICFRSCADIVRL